MTSYGELCSVNLSHHVILLKNLPRLHREVCAYRCVNGPGQKPSQIPTLVWPPSL